MRSSKTLSTKSANTSTTNSVLSEERKLQDLRYLKRVLEQEERQRSQVVPYPHVAIHDKTGHKIGSHDGGKSWHDVKTGAPFHG